MKSAPEVYGQALLDYQHGEFKGPLWLNTSYGTREKMPVEVFFRKEQDLSDLESYALSLCKGTLLDIGAGAGVFSLIFQDRGWSCASLDVSRLACEVMHERGLQQIIQADIRAYTHPKYDTLWLMMNGIGIFGRVNRLVEGLKHLAGLLNPGGRIILDSSDIRYLYGDSLPEWRYFGEIEYQYEYKRQTGEWFPWLYVDQRLLILKAREAGLNAQVVFENDQDEYLAILTLIT